MGLGHRINSQLNATSNMESTYLFPEADRPPCMLCVLLLDEVVKQHIPPLFSVTLDKCNVEVEKKFP